MILEEANKLQYLESVFRDVRELDGIAAQTKRINLIKGNSYNKDESVLFKRWRWFSLLSESNDIFQKESNLKPEEQVEILCEIQKHPYFDHFVNKKLLLQLIKNHKEFQALINEQPKEIAEVIFGLYHLKSDVHNRAVTGLQELCESPKEKKKLRKAISKIRKQFPEMYDNFKEIYSALGIGKINTFENFSEKAKSMPWYLNLLFAWLIIKLLVFIIKYFSS